jgi:hypothetical protein
MTGGVEWVASSGVAGSLGAGALILGYYWMYWYGVRRRTKNAERKTKNGTQN